MKKKRSFSSEHKVLAIENGFSEHWAILVKYSALVLTRKKYCLCGFFNESLWKCVSNYITAHANIIKKAKIWVEYNKDAFYIFEIYTCCSFEEKNKNKHSHK